MPTRHVKKKGEKKRKRRKDAYPKKVCHMPPRHDKRKIRRKYSLYPKKIQGREKSYKGVHPSSTKNIHTLAHLDQGL